MTYRTIHMRPDGLAETPERIDPWGDLKRLAMLVALDRHVPPKVTVCHGMDTAPLRPGDCSVNGWRG